MPYNIHRSGKAYLFLVGKLYSSTALLTVSAIISLAVCAFPARASSEDILAAALKRIEALESKTDRLAEENKQLRSQLRKTSEMALKEPVKYTHTNTLTGASGSTETNTSAPLPANIFLAQKANWGGIYAGINAGYAAGQANYTANAAGPVYYNRGPGAAWLYPQIYDSFPSFYSLNGVNNLNGLIVGGQIGYNHQFDNNLVLGAETDFNYADINNRYATGDINNISSANQRGINNIYYNDRTGVNWVGTARLRLGYDLGKFLPYITAGLAYGNVSNNSLGVQEYIYEGTFRGGSSTTNSSSVTTGWAAGAGAEYIVADNWSVKGEYLFTQLGNLNIQGYPASINPPLAGTSVLNGTIGPWLTHQARVGLNYHTDWLAFRPSLTTKY